MTIALVSLLSCATAALARQARPPVSDEARRFYALAQQQESAGRIAEAEATYRKFAALDSKDNVACRLLAGFLNKPLWNGKAKFDEAIATLERCAAIDPNDAEGYHTLATFYWDKSYRDPALDDKQKDAYAGKGLVEVDKALKLRPDFFEATIYKGLLYRSKASASHDPRLQAQYLEQATALQKRGAELRKQWDLQQKFAGDPALKAFVEKLEASVKAGDSSAFDKVMDVDAAIDAAIKGIDGPAGLVSQFRAIEKAQSQFGAAIVEMVKKGAGFSFLRIRQGEAGRPQAQFRLLAAEGGANYYELALRRDASGGVEMVDYYVYAAGEWKSESLRRNWLAAVAEAGLGAQLKRLAGFENDMVKSLPQLQALFKLQAQGQNQAALQALLQLPASVQSTKNLMTIRAVIAQKLGEREYGEAMEAYFKQFPNDPALHLLLIDFFAGRKQYDPALESIERVSQALGGDAYLDVMRGNVHYMKRDLAAAKAAFRRATFQEPSLLPPYWGLVRVSLEEKNHQDTALYLTMLEKERSVQIGDLKGIVEYADFVRSDSYKTWLNSRSRVEGGISEGVVGGVVGGLPAAPPPPAAVRVGGAIKEPKKLVHVNPVYPAIAQSARVQGVVILECTIAPDGTVSDAKVLRSIPLLDQAAVDAVTQWRFAPTQLNGVPVAVIMTVTVNFSLS